MPEEDLCPRLQINPGMSTLGLGIQICEKQDQLEGHESFPIPFRAKSAVGRADVAHGASQVKPLYLPMVGPEKSHIGFSFFFFLRQSLTLWPGWKAVAQSWLSTASTSQDQRILLPQPPK